MSGHGALSPRQFHQLPMFVTAETLRDVDQTIPGDFSRYAYHAEEWHEKALASSWAAKLQDGIRKKRLDQHIASAGGVEESVLLTQDRIVGERPELSDGHHRTAVAYHLNPKSLLPVRHQVRG